MKLIVTLFLAIIGVIAFLSSIARDAAIAEEAWDLHLTKKKLENIRRKEEPHEDS